MKYTPHPTADKAIQKYLDSITEVILKHIPQTKSIILGGGFGRGEGSVKIKGDTVIPINDFDMFVVTEKDIPEQLLNTIANQASSTLPKEIGPTGTNFYSFDPHLHARTFYVDLKALPLKKLPHLPPMFRYFELKNASTIIHGKDYRHLIPKYQIDDLPLAEGFRLLLNRMALLCLYFSLDFINRPLTPTEKHGLLYLASKSLIDLTAPLLQLNHQYTPTYQERLTNLKKTYRRDFPQLYTKLPRLPQQVKKATRFKLNPNSQSHLRPFPYWSLCKKHIGETTLYFARSFFDQKIPNYSTLSDLIYQKAWPKYYTPYLKHFLNSHFKIGFASLPAALLLQPYINLHVYQRFQKHTHINHPRLLLNHRGFDLILYSAMIPLLYSVDDQGKIDLKMLHQARKILEKVFPVTYNGTNKTKLWNAVNHAFSTAYANFSFLKII